MARELPPSSVAPVGTSIGTPASAEQVTPELSDPLPPSEDAAQVDDLVFLVPSAWPKGATVLHIGDSFAGALGGQLNRELARRGVTGVLEFETGTYIATWAARRRLAAPLARHRPSLVLITLGANELDIARPASRADVVRRLVGALEGRPCVWIAPPLWEGAKADVLRVIEANCAPCAYLDSTKLVPNLERLPDKVHPSSAGRARWAKAVITWLDEHPIEGLEPRWVSLEP
jgi:lysophospholipase L1-like esterase